MGVMENTARGIKIDSNMARGPLGPRAILESILIPRAVFPLLPFYPPSINIPVFSGHSSSIAYLLNKNLQKFELYK